LNSIDLDQQSPEASLAKIKKTIGVALDAVLDQDNENPIETEKIDDITKFDQTFNEVEEQDWA
jgi:hypothetical protein